MNISISNPVAFEIILKNNLILYLMISLYQEILKSLYLTIQLWFAK